MQRNQCIQQKDTTRQHQLLQWSLTSPNKQLLPTANPPIPSAPRPCGRSANSPRNDCSVVIIPSATLQGLHPLYCLRYSVKSF